MNKRIRELIKQHGVNITIDGLGYGEGNVEGLAELIIRECMSLCEDVKFQHSQYRKQETDFGMKNIYAEGEATCDLLQNKMKQHFGVEE